MRSPLTSRPGTPCAPRAAWPAAGERTSPTDRTASDGETGARAHHGGWHRPVACSGRAGGGVMRVGVQMVFQSYGYGPDVGDGQVVADEVRLGVLADELGFDALWPVEHHFADYAFCPDNTVFLANMAARTQRIRLGT